MLMFKEEKYSVAAGREQRIPGRNSPADNKVSGEGRSETEIQPTVRPW